MNGIFKEVRPLDYALAGLVTVVGAFLTYENIAAPRDGLPYARSTKSWLVLPVFILVMLPILWRHHCILAVVGVTAVTTAVHMLAFGRINHCGVKLPLTYPVGRFAGAWKSHLIGLAGIVVAQQVMIARDASIDTMAGALPLAFPAIALYGIGLLMQNRVSKKRSITLAPIFERAAA